MVSGRCLGDIVKKLGERIMPEVVPILQDGLKQARGCEADWAKRQGVCIGLSEVISCATHNQLEDYLDGLLGCVQEVILSVTCPDFFAHHSITFLFEGSPEANR